MLNSPYNEIFFESKTTLTSIRKELENKLQNGSNNTDLEIIDNYLSLINKINSKLSLFSRNIKKLEEYINILKQYSSNIYIIEDKEVEKNFKKTDIETGISNYLFRINKKFSEINLVNNLLNLDVNNLKINNINTYEKLDFELSAFIQDSKEVINHFKPIIDDYRNNIQMLPVFEASKRNIEKSLVSYINDKKSEIDLYFNSLKDEINSTKNNFKFLDQEISNIKKIHSSINKDQNEIVIKNSQLYKNINDLDLNFKNKQNELDLRIDTEIASLKETIYTVFEEDLLKFNKELNEVNNIIEEEVNSIKNTSKSFKDFISDETSIKLTNDYKTKANIEMYSYYFFNILSILIIIIAISMSWHSLNIFTESHIGNNKNYDGYDLAYLSIRLIFSLIVFSSIAFTSKLASKSYIYWKKNEGIFLRLTALKSFIADMSKEKKQEIHEKLVDVYFGKDELENNSNQKIKDLPNNITQLLGKVVEHSSSILDSKKESKESVNN